MCISRMPEHRECLCGGEIWLQRGRKTRACDSMRSTEALSCSTSSGSCSCCGGWGCCCPALPLSVFAQSSTVKHTHYPLNSYQRLIVSYGNAALLKVGRLVQAALLPDGGPALAGHRLQNCSRTAT